MVKRLLRPFLLIYEYLTRKEEDPRKSVARAATFLLMTYLTAMFAVTCALFIVFLLSLPYLYPLYLGLLFLGIGVSVIRIITS